jgi:alpha-methylacyl-CoA racemase
VGPLLGFTVIELAGIGPAPMAGMLFADMGAEVISVDRDTHTSSERLKDVSFRGKKSIALDLKKPAGVETLLKLVEKADALIEGYRPGVAERLGIGPEVCQRRNPKLVYGRMTGWGQEGPLAKAAGHDINFIAITGVLHAIGRQGERPVPPLNLVADMGGGGMLLAFGVVCALLEAQRSGKGQIVDAAMVDGAAQLMWMMYSFQASGLWNGRERGVNLLDGGAHFYDTMRLLTVATLLSARLNPSSMPSSWS